MPSSQSKFRTLLTGDFTEAGVAADPENRAARGHADGSDDGGHGAHGVPSAHSAHSAHAVHVVPMWLLCLIFAILLVLTVATVAVYQFNFGYRINLAIALGIAVIKAGLVAMYFMHLRWDNPFNGLVFITALIFVALFIGGTVEDTTHYNANYKQTANTPQNP